MSQVSDRPPTSKMSHLTLPKISDKGSRRAPSARKLSQQNVDKSISELSTQSTPMGALTPGAARNVRLALKKASTMREKKNEAHLSNVETGYESPTDALSIPTRKDTGQDFASFVR